MEALYLIVRIAGEVVAVNATDVGSVIEIDTVTPVPRVPAHIAGLFALRSRVLTVIDTRAALGLGRTDLGPIAEAVVIQADGHSYALLVDAVEDVATAGVAAPCTAVLGGGWGRAAVGQLACERGTLLLIDPTLLVAGPESVAA